MKPVWLAIVALVSIGCGDAVVGGACADGYDYCDGACRPAAACRSGSVDGGEDVMAADSAASSDAAGLDTAESSVIDANAASDSCPAPPYSSATHCGACAVACTGATPICKLQSDGTFACAAACSEPETLCPIGCVDLAVDPRNCGACGDVCPTGLCNGGTCRGANAGHVVVAGHDFVAASPALAVSRVISNAVFLPSKNPVRVIAFEQWADPSAVASVRQILDETARLSGRTYTKTVAGSAADFRDRLRIDMFDVALVFDQITAPLSVLGSLGADTKSSFDSFSRVGGVVVVLDGGAGRSEMPNFLTASGLVGVSGHSANTERPVDVVAPADAIAVGVLSPYSAPARSVTLSLSEPPSPSLITVVAEPVSGKPVVLHKVVFK
jgi:hypothetical protein